MKKQTKWQPRERATGRAQSQAVGGSCPGLKGRRQASLLVQCQGLRAGADGGGSHSARCVKVVMQEPEPRWVADREGGVA